MLELAKAKSAFNPSIVVLAEAKSNSVDNNASCVLINSDWVSDKSDCVAARTVSVLDSSD